MTALDFLISDEFRLQAGMVSSARNLRRWLLRCDAVGEVRRALVEGRLVEATVRVFAERLMDSFERGRQFPFAFELALAALAAALESRPTRFAEEYLSDLARLSRIAEMDLAPRVAALSLAEWRRGAPKVVVKHILSSLAHVQFSRAASVTLPFRPVLLDLKRPVALAANIEGVCLVTIPLSAERRKTYAPA